MDSGNKKVEMAQIKKREKSINAVVENGKQIKIKSKKVQDNHSHLQKLGYILANSFNSNQSTNAKTKNQH